MPSESLVTINPLWSKWKLAGEKGVQVWVDIPSGPV